MKKKIEKLKKDFQSALKRVRTSLDLEELQKKFFSRASGQCTALMKELNMMGDDTKKEIGAALNDMKKELNALIDAKRMELRRRDSYGAAEREAIDVTQPELPAEERGHLHPVTQVQMDLEKLFTSLGFRIADGPELESDYYNFTAVNIPPEHPARDMQDTFYLKNPKSEIRNPKSDVRWVMRTHTSPVQVRAMREYGAPLRVIVPGRCFRNEATDPRHEHTLYQIEGLVVDTDITFSHMKGVLEIVAKHLYGNDTRVRMRPKFYPFVEPGVNGEVTCYLCHGNGCRVCKGSGWLEIFGAGLVHPNVLREGGIDPEQYQGFAFGLGLQRLVMLKYGIEDIRLLQSGDLRFLKQF